MRDHVLLGRLEAKPGMTGVRMYQSNFVCARNRPRRIGAFMSFKSMHYEECLIKKQASMVVVVSNRQTLDSRGLSKVCKPNKSWAGVPAARSPCGIACMEPSIRWHNNPCSRSAAAVLTVSQRRWPNAMCHGRRDTDMLSDIWWSAFLEHSDTETIWRDNVFRKRSFEPGSGQSDMV